MNESCNRIFVIICNYFNMQYNIIPNVEFKIQIIKQNIEVKNWNDFDANKIISYAKQKLKIDLDRLINQDQILQNFEMNLWSFVYLIISFNIKNLSNVSSDISLNNSEILAFNEIITVLNKKKLSNVYTHVYKKSMLNTNLSTTFILKFDSILDFSRIGFSTKNSIIENHINDFLNTTNFFWFFSTVDIYKEFRKWSKQKGIELEKEIFLPWPLLLEAKIIKLRNKEASYYYSNWNNIYESSVRITNNFY